MQSLFFFQTNTETDKRKAVAPVVYQEGITLAAGAGASFTKVMDLADGTCCGYGGQIINQGCYDIQVNIKYMAGADCDSCTDDQSLIYNKCILLEIPANTVFPMPDGFFGSVYVRTIDSSGLPVSNTSEQTVKIYSSHVPDCGDCVQSVITAAPPYDSGMLTYTGGATKSVSAYNFPASGWNIWFWGVDNNFNIKLNGQDIATVQEVNLWPPVKQTYINAGFTCANLTYADGTPINGSPWSYPSTNPNPMIKMNISPAGVITCTAIRNGVYVPVVFSDGASWKTMTNINTGCTNENILTVSQSNTSPPTNITFKIFGS